MGLRLKPGAIVGFLNKDIFYVDVKLVSLDRVLTNLYIKMYAHGAPINMMYRDEYTIDRLKQNILALENREQIKGAAENIDGVDDWLRSSLLELVNRGNVVKEHVSTLKPLHLLSFRVLNKKFCRDYRAADQLYLMLHANPEVMNGLEKYLSKGWDRSTNGIVDNEDLDIDTAGILYLTKDLKEIRGINRETINIPQPFLTKQAELFNEDIKRLLIYKDKLPRSVFIDYLRILCGFHLSLYIMKLIYLLPKMVETGSRDVNDDWSMVVDMTDDLDSVVSQYACKDVEKMENSYWRYIRSTYMIDLVQKRHSLNGYCSVEEAMELIKEGTEKEHEYYNMELLQIRNNLEPESDRDFDQNDFKELLQYFPEKDYLGMLVHIMENSNLGSYQYRYLKEFIDSVSMKNSPSMLLADSRSKRHPRRGVIGSKLLETLVQLLVLKEKEDGSYESCSLSIDDLATAIRQRYGLIINGADEPRFADMDVETNAAFSKNMEALKNKLRQIGFYTDMSDACILQKIRPRYKL